MPSYINVSGNFTLAVNELLSKNTDEIFLSCDTSAAPVNIQLPAISTLRGFGLDLVVIINDISENAGTNPITIFANAADKVNNAASVVMSFDGQSAEIRPSNFNDWIAEATPAFSPTPFIIGDINCTANPNYPAANAGVGFRVTLNAGVDKGRIGGAAGVVVEAGDIIYCLQTNAGGTQAAVGAFWTVWEGETFQLWDNGSGTQAIVQVNQTTPNTSAGAQGIATGSGTSIDADSDNANASGDGAQVVNSDFADVGGQGNIATDSQGAFIRGQDNEADTSDNADITGFGNEIDTCLHAHAEGQSNVIDSSDCAHAEGQSNVIEDSGNSHVEGIDCENTSSFNAHAEGNTAINDTSNSGHAEGGATLNFNSAFAHVEGAGSSNDTSANAHAEGQGTLNQISANAHAEGQASENDTSANAHAEGQSTLNDTSANAHAEGQSTTNDTSANAHAEGQSTLNDTSANAHAEGSSTTNLDSANAHAEGSGTLNDTSANAHVEGQGNTNTTSANAHSEGQGNTNTTSANAHSEGQSNAITDSPNAHAEGQSNTITSADNSHAENQSNQIAAGADASSASGRQSRASLETERVHASGRFTVNGDAQRREVEATAVTDGAVAEILEIDSQGSGASISIPVDTAWKFTIDAVASRHAGAGVIGDTHAWQLQGCIKNVGGTTTLVGTVIFPFDDADAAAAAWTLVATADDVSDRLVLTATAVGEADDEFIRWVANVRLTQVGFNTYA
jgi:hypothetical protein